MEASSGFHRFEASGDRSLAFELFELSVRRQDKSIWPDHGGQALFPRTRDQEWRGQSLMKVCVCVCVCVHVCVCWSMVDSVRFLGLNLGVWVRKPKQFALEVLHKHVVRKCWDSVDSFLRASFFLVNESRTGLEWV